MTNELLLYTLRCKGCSWQIHDNLIKVTQAQYEHLKATKHNHYEMVVSSIPDLD